MAGSFPIPQQTYDPAHGPYLFGPQSVAPNDSLILLTLDRMVPGGLNSLDEATSVELLAEQSNDGGVSWFRAVGADFPGGQQFTSVNKGDPPTLRTQNTARVGVYGSGPGRQLRAVLTVTGSPVVLAGTLAVS